MAEAGRRIGNPLSLIVKDDCVLLRSSYAGASASGGRNPVDPVVVFRPSKTAVGHAVTETMTYQEAVKSGVMLGNELELEVEALLGCITLLGGPYIVTVDLATTVGMAPNYVPIRAVTSLGVRPVSRAARQAAVGQYGAKHCDERRYLQMLRSPVVAGHLYFSHRYPLHRRLQDNAQLSPELSFEAAAAYWGSATAGGGGTNGNGASPWAARFLWNGLLLRGIADEKARAAWATACVSGYAGSRATDFCGEQVTLTLLSRRSTRRQGTRFYRRGAGQGGDVANFVETEMVLYRPDGSRVAHVQVRGSVPVPWKQTPDLSWQPPITHPAHSRQLRSQACRLHTERLASRYGAVALVNLIDSCGSKQHSKDQAELGARYADSVQCLPGYRPLSEPPAKDGPSSVYLTWFDFHKECKGKRWERLGALMGQVEGLLASFGCTVLAPQRGKVADQTGVLRTNCVDNLDRTNVVQSVFARRVLLTALGQGEDAAVKASVLKSPFASFEANFKDLWVANANALSELYAGTPALKTEYVRTGKSSIRADLVDGASALQRYYINNFWDGRRQDSVDLWLGAYRPKPDQPSPFPPYPLPFVPGGLVFTVSYAIQSLPPYKLTLTLGARTSELVLFLVGLWLGVEDDSPILIALFAGAMLLLMVPAFWECIVTVGPISTWRTLRELRLYVDRPLLVRDDDDWDQEIVVSETKS